MKVKDLIKRLSEFDPDAQVVVAKRFSDHYYEPVQSVAELELTPELQQADPECMDSESEEYEKWGDNYGLPMDDDEWERRRAAMEDASQTCVYLGYYG